MPTKRTMYGLLTAEMDMDVPRFTEIMNSCDVVIETNARRTWRKRPDYDDVLIDLFDRFDRPKSGVDSPGSVEGFELSVGGADS
ncbi:hypothetical protein MLD38_026228 [Melastoma candidum]|uniref:Uncharacterized protein n=1 Tax=Melastoma candidum TaxID=119954 RepID=A0ACB9P1F4_9MYRT|nr:hypothetical protein MLD38_026228 [Melastoma candidum]